MTERPGSSAGRERDPLPNRASTTVSDGGSVDGWAMARALSLAAGALGRTSPNPAVGAVIVDGSGIVVGEGATRAYGQAHAEPVALAMAGGRARDATLYVTLEPCSHHGRTPPCADAVVAAGVTRVVVSTLDPNPRVAGRGIARLREAGVSVEVGPGAGVARTLMAGFATWIATQRPHVIAKFAASLDGRIATRTGESRWISGPEARRWAHGVRDHVDAILVGAGTVRADDPALTSRTAHLGQPVVEGEEADPLLDRVVPSRPAVAATHADAARQPLRVVLDTQLTMPLTSQLASGRLPGATLVVGVDDGTADWASRRASLARGGVEVASVGPGVDGRPAVAAVLDLLGARGVTTLLVEGGATVHEAFFRAGLVDRVAAVLAPVVIGGGHPAVGTAASGPDHLSGASRLQGRSVTLLGEDVLVTGWLRRPAWLDDAAPG